MNIKKLNVLEQMNKTKNIVYAGHKKNNKSNKNREVLYTPYIIENILFITVSLFQYNSVLHKFFSGGNTQLRIYIFIMEF